MFITSNAQLRVVIERGIDTALKQVMDEAEEELHNQFSVAGIPVRGAGLSDAWDKITGHLMAEFKYTPGRMDLFQAPFPEGIHGSTLAGTKGGSAPNDVREYMADIIFQGLAPINPHLGKAGGTQPARDAWKPFLRAVSAKMSEWIIKAMSAQGFAIY